MDWRIVARLEIEKVIGKYGLSHPDIKKFISDAYPFGERKYWPRKVWLDEVKKCLGGTKNKSHLTKEEMEELFRRPL
jgi:hypothetical protein